MTHILKVGCVAALIAGPVIAWLHPPWYAQLSIIMAAAFLVGASSR